MLKQMTNAEYHADTAISKSDLDLIHRSILHWKTAKEQPREQTPSLLLGSVTHKLVLEPDTFGNEFILAPHVDKRTKDGKAEWAAFEAQATNKTIITDDVYAQAKAIADSVLSDQTASQLFKDGKAEQSYFWEENGVICKCRPDYLRNDGYVIDFKTTQNATVDEFTKSAYNYRYYVQAWWYMHGLARCGVDVKGFIFVAAEKEAPYAVNTFAADDLMFKLGEREALADFEKYKKFTETNNCFGYDEEPIIHSLSLPDWVIRKEGL